MQRDLDVDLLAIVADNGFHHNKNVRPRLSERCRRWTWWMVDPDAGTRATTTTPSRWRPARDEQDIDHFHNRSASGRGSSGSFPASSELIPTAAAIGQGGIEFGDSLGDPPAQRRQDRYVPVVGLIAPDPLR